MILNGCKGGSYQLTTTTTLCFSSLTTTTTVCKENILDGRRNEQLCSLRLLNTSRPVYPRLIKDNKQSVLEATKQ